MVSKQADPIQDSLPVIVLFIIMALVLALLLADSSGDSDAADAGEVVAVEEDSEAVAEADEPETTEEGDSGVAVADTGFMTFDAAIVEQGQQLYQVSCAACHGMDAQGISGMGKNLVDSEFMDSLHADGFVAFTNVGRRAFDPANTTGMEMPARGTNPSLTDDEIRAIYTFIRAETAEFDGEIVVFADDVGYADNPDGGPFGDEAEAALEESAAEPEAEVQDESTAEVAEPSEFVPLGPDGSIALEDLPYDVAHIYALSCSGCHGLDGEGVEGYAQPFGEIDPDAAFEMLTTTSPVTDLDVESGVPHPVRAEPAFITDEQLRELIEFIASLGG